MKSSFVLSLGLWYCSRCAKTRAAPKPATHITFSHIQGPGQNVCKYENVYTVYILSPLITTDFRILDGIPKVVNVIIAFNNNNEKQTS